MALRLRRGTDAERQLITPVEGELIYTTDTKLLYAGDGTTAGGTLVTGSGGGGGSTTLNALTDTDLTGASNSNVLTYNSGTSKWAPAAIPSLALADLSNVNTVSVTGGDLLQYDGSNFTPRSIAEVLLDVDVTLTGTFDGDMTGSVFSDNSSILVDGNNNTFHGDLTGNVVGNVVGSLIGDVTGDVVGSVFNDNSSVVIDGQFGDVYPRQIVTAGQLRIVSPSAAATNFIQMESNDEYTSLALLRTSASNLTGTNQRYGQLKFGKEDSSGRTDSSIISGNEDYLWIFNGADGTVTESKVLTIAEGDVGIGTIAPTAKLDVRGAIKPGVYADNTARDAAITTPTAGMMVFNTTGTKFQGYTGSAWVDLN